MERAQQLEHVKLGSYKRLRQKRGILVHQPEPDNPGILLHALLLPFLRAAADGRFQLRPQAN
eukprot:scaffold7340_cov266-Pinguiococcus_pyrenoidosus.AAC.75